MAIRQATCKTLFEAPTTHKEGPRVELERWQWENGKVHYILTTWDPATQQWYATDIGKYIGPDDAVRFAATIYKCLSCGKWAKKLSAVATERASLH
jgi:hypothetical protein